LLFELLTGSPPFEGANQNELFDNILNFRIKWPKGFSGVARDLVSKLLKTNPAERPSLDDITNHPWFKANPPIKPIVSESTAAPISLKLDLQEEIKKENY